MPVYRLTPPGEYVEAERVDVEGAFTVLRGSTLVIGRPRQVVVRRVPATVVVEDVTGRVLDADLTGPPMV